MAGSSAGCESHPAPKSTHISRDYDGRFSNTISYESFGATSSVDCAEGKTLNVAGSNNKLTVRGRCQSVTVAGSDNRITFEHIDRALTITGFNNAITYLDGAPTLSNRGSGNSVTGKH